MLRCVFLSCCCAFYAKRCRYNERASFISGRVIPGNVLLVKRHGKEMLYVRAFMCYHYSLSLIHTRARVIHHHHKVSLSATGSRGGQPRSVEQRLILGVQSERGGQCTGAL